MGASTRAVKVAFLKLGVIGASPLLENLLDERADRPGIEVRVWGSGTKMQESQAALADEVAKWLPDLAVLACPNAGLPGPARAWKALAKAGPTLVVSDGPTRKAAPEMEKTGAGYILLTGDVMLGARREFLDPTEMALFNADLLKVLAVSGALRLLHEEMDRILEGLARGRKPALPRLVADGPAVVARAGFSNPHAASKALAAHRTAEAAGALAHEACFRLQRPEDYIPACAAVHEMVRAAARVADEARELEKGGNTLLRTPHGKSGELLRKTGLTEKPR